MTRRQETAPVATPAGFFCLRTPLLPFESLLRWSDGLGAPRATPEARAAAIAHDVARLRERLRALVTLPAVREAIFVASPSLEEALHAWLQAPESDRGRRAERSLVKYLGRLTTRPTPFGLFAAVATGSTGRDTRLEVPPSSELRRHTRLDNAYLFSLSHALRQDPEIRHQARYRPNDSLVFSAGHGRYAEARPARGGDHTFHLVSVEESPELRETLARADTPGGAGWTDLVTALVDPGTTRAEAQGFVDELIESQLLVPDVGVPVTGEEPARALAEGLARIEAARPIQAGLEQALASLEQLDANGLGNPPERYRTIARELESLPGDPKLHHLFQVDLLRPRAGRLGEAVLAEIRRGVNLLHRITPGPSEFPLARFAAAFTSRYEGRAVPLLEALDDEIGVGRALWPESDPSPLLRDLPVQEPETPRLPWGPRDRHLMHRVGLAAADGELVWELDREDLEALSEPAPRPLPEGGAVMATLSAASEAAVGRGDFALYLSSFDGPTGARLLGRFCHADPGLHAQVMDQLRQEERGDPDAIHAELVHLSEGRLGNILLRPVLREYELTYLGQSGAPPDRQIPASDLVLTVRGGWIDLWSRRLGRRVIPRLTTAHNYTMGLTPYRFLALLQSQGRAQALRWIWGPAGDAPFVPRVTQGRLVLALARWRLGRAEVRALRAATLAQRFDAVQALRARRRLPRWVTVVDQDNRLPVDLDNPLMVECLVHESGEREEATLEELWPPEDRLPASGPEGRFRHELVVPLRIPDRVAGDPTAPPVPRPPAQPDGARRFGPGSEWLYIKLHASEADSDDILERLVGPLSHRWARREAIDTWFFVRYSEPDHQLRWRLHGQPAALWRRVWPAIRKAAGQLLEGGKAWRIQLDTYDREVERYGGPEAIGLAERLFQADSESVIDLLGMFEPGDPGLDERWRVALFGADRWLEDFGLTLPERLRLVRESARYGAVPEPPVTLRHRLTDRFREHRAQIEALLDPAPAAGPLEPGLAVLRERSVRTGPAVARLLELARLGRLETSLPELVGSVVHMHLNRILRGASNAHETVIYDFLRRIYESRLARERTAHPGGDP